jgi:hypothetical protein
MDWLVALTGHAMALAAAACVVTAGGSLDGAAAPALPGGLHAPRQGVLCHRERQVCYDRYGPSIGLTEAFLGGPAAARLTAILRQIPAPERLGTIFSPADGVECVRETGPCRAHDRAEVGLSAVLFGPWPAPGDPAEVPAER